MKKAQVTLVDIARETGYSVNTISHALRDKSDISAATKEFIRKTAEDLGYIRNLSASSLRSGISKSIAVIVGDIANPHFAILVKEIETSIRGEGYTVFVLNTEEDEQTEYEAIVSAIGKNVDGIILCPAQKSEENVRYLQRSGVPFVLMGRHSGLTGVRSVICDDENGGYLAARHLFQSGHQQILFLNGPSCTSSARERLVGVQRAFEEAGIDFRPENHTNIGAVAGDGGYGPIREAMSRLPEVSAIICFSDLVAWETAYALQKMGKRVPEDISLVGFDNIQSKFVFPLLLTSVTSSKSKMSRKAVEMLLAAIQNPSSEPQQIVLPTKILVRESTRERKTV